MKTTRILTFILAAALILSLLAGCGGAPAATPTPAAAPTPAADPEPAPGDGGYEEGTSATDDIVNTTAADKVILVVSFGTSFNDSRHLTIGGIETAIKNAYPDYQVRRAFTSQIIIDKLAEREGLKIDNVTEAMNRLVLDKVKEVIIQPTTVMDGFEFNDMINEVMPFADKFESMKIGKHLLADDADYETVAELLVEETARFRADGTAIVYMGHGTEHEAGATYNKLQDMLLEKGYDDYIIGTVEHGIEIDDVREMLSGMDVKKVVLRPLMIVAGDHANNDMAGDEEDSWKIILKEDGYEVETVLEGLGQIKGVQELFTEHVQDAIQSTPISAAPVAAATGVTANRIKNGSYSIEAETDSSMFRIVECSLTVDDGVMTAEITLSGQGYAMLYMGSADEAPAEESNHIDHTLADEKHSFTIPVAALDTDIALAALGTRSGNWYDHVIVLKTAGIPDDAFTPLGIDVTLTGGSGRAGVEPRAELFYRNGTDIARIVWSSPNYIYMLVDGAEYPTVNTEGNSAFEIPVKMDTDMTVIACTVAMGDPKEIEYVLHFDSASIG